MLTGSATTITVVTLAFRPEHTVAIIGGGIVASNVLSSLFGMVFVRRRLGHLGGHGIARTWLRIGSASVVAAVIAWPVVLGFDGLVSGRLGAVLVLVVGGCVFGVAYLLMAWILRIREVAELLDPVLRRLPRRGGRHDSSH